MFSMAFYHEQVVMYATRKIPKRFLPKSARVCEELSVILNASAYGFENAHVSSGKLCACVAKIWLFGPHSACSLIQRKLFASSISTSSRGFVLLRN